MQTIQCVQRYLILQLLLHRHLSFFFLSVCVACYIGKQRALSLDVWLSPIMCVILGETQFAAFLRSACEKYQCLYVQMSSDWTRNSSSWARIRLGNICLSSFSLIVLAFLSLFSFFISFLSFVVFFLNIFSALWILHFLFPSLCQFFNAKIYDMNLKRRLR